ncbi:hypothetical protein HK405_008510 [Cladochytrium tenue]|nr:hypothetical protein HK405_008510 [Cladochytrium tenue]
MSATATSVTSPPTPPTQPPSPWHAGSRSSSSSGAGVLDPHRQQQQHQLQQLHGPARRHAGPAFAGAALAGCFELFLFHPVDTAAKRLIHHRGRNFPKGATLREAAQGVSKVVFRDAAGKGLTRELASLYPAFGYAVVYKMLQRSLQFGMHPVFDAHARHTFGPAVQATVGDVWARAVTAGAAGIAIGVCEVVLLPLDALKVKRQTGVRVLSTAPLATATVIVPGTGAGVAADAARRRLLHVAATSAVPPLQPLPNNSSSSSSTAHLLRNPRLLGGLYRGAAWTAARNAVGCFALFGASTLVRDQVFHHYRRPAGPGAPPLPAPPVHELFLASLAGALSSIAASAPLDVVKVRMQAAAPLDAPGVSGLAVIRSLVRTEGIGAFAKGAVPKMLASGPKVTFSYTVAQVVAAWVEANWDARAAAAATAARA